MVIQRDSIVRFQSTYRGYKARKKIEFSKMLNHWVKTGPNNETADRQATIEIIKSVHENRDHALYIYSKNISSLPDIFDHLAHLHEVHINHTNLKELPGSLFKLTHLTSLGLSENKLTHLSKEIKNLKKLVWLCLERNHLTNLPIKELVNLTCLKHLRCSENIIIHVHTYLLEKFEEVNFRKNFDNVFYEKSGINYDLIETCSLEKLEVANHYLKKSIRSENIINPLRNNQVEKLDISKNILYVLINRKIKKTKT